MSLVRRVERWGWRVVGASPGQDLLSTELVGCFLRVEALEISVVTFVEPPTAFGGDVLPPGLLEGQIGGLDATWIGFAGGLRIRRPGGQ